MAITYVLIGSATSTGSSTDLTVSGIPDTYDDLLVKISARGTVNSIRTGCAIFINGDFTTTNITRSEYWTEDDAYGAENKVTNNPNLGSVPGNSSISDLFSLFDFIIPSYAGTSNRKIWQGRAVQSNRDASITRWTDWLTYAKYTPNTNAITQVTSKLSDNMATGSKMTVYGIKNT